MDLLIGRLRRLVEDQDPAWLAVGLFALLVMLMWTDFAVDTILRWRGCP